ncbi:MAG: ANTAR domain-containing protein [Mycobacterium sp.]|nr:ANTAR domain-containing protein [Mycobacterium sp.]
MGQEIQEITESRAAIGQAKGILRLIYDIDDAAAFEVLRWRSQLTNTKLLRLAEQFVEDFIGCATPSLCRTARSTTIS